MPRPPPSDRESRYRALLFKHMAGREPGEIAFFVNPRRFAIFSELAGAALHRSDMRVLNVACGPFALEFYALTGKPDITAIDIDPVLEDLHADLVRHDLIAPTHFVAGDVMGFKTDEQFDLVVINDLFYTKYVDFFAVIDKYAGLVKPGGMLYFDILDRRAGALWRLFNKDSRYRRYDMDAVRRELARHGFDIRAERPSLGIKGGADFMVRSALWRLFGLANNIIFSAVRRPLPANVLPLAKRAGRHAEPVPAEPALPPAAGAKIRGTRSGRLAPPSEAT